MPASTPVQPPSPFLLRWFRRYVRRFLRKNFHRVRLLGTPPEAPADGAPLVVFMNHPSWWDPMVGLFLAETYFPERDHYAPIDRAALERYGVLKKMGFFGIEAGRPRGAKQFLDGAAEILGQSETALWLTPQGQFVDPRQRPIAFKPGLAHLATQLPAGRAIPLAIEYPFWDERSPELLVTFGTPLEISETGEPAEWQQRLEDALAGAQDRLADSAMARDPSAFTELLGGKAGVGGFYDLWRSTRARLRGERFQHEHSPAPDPPADRD